MDEGDKVAKALKWPLLRSIESTFPQTGSHMEISKLLHQKIVTIEFGPSIYYGNSIQNTELWLYQLMESEAVIKCAQ